MLFEVNLPEKVNKFLIKKGKKGFVFVFENDGLEDLHLYLFLLCFPIGYRHLTYFGRPKLNTLVLACQDLACRFLFWRYLCLVALSVHISALMAGTQTPNNQVSWFEFKF